MMFTMSEPAYHAPIQPIDRHLWLSQDENNAAMPHKQTIMAKLLNVGEKNKVAGGWFSCGNIARPNAVPHHIENDNITAPQTIVSTCVR
jgi:hypothetical protein